MPESFSKDDLCGIRVVHRTRVARARENALPESQLDRMAATFKLLGDPTRLKIVLALKNVEMCVCDLAAYLCLSESAVSHQLRRLRDMSLVKHRRDGQILYYSLVDKHVGELLDLSLKHAGEGAVAGDR